MFGETKDIGTGSGEGYNGGVGGDEQNDGEYQVMIPSDKGVKSRLKNLLSGDQPKKQIEKADIPQMLPSEMKKYHKLQNLIVNYRTDFEISELQEFVAQIRNAYGDDIRLMTISKNFFDRVLAAESRAGKVDTNANIIVHMEKLKILTNARGFLERRIHQYTTGKKRYVRP